MLHYNILIKNAKLLKKANLDDWLRSKKSRRKSSKKDFRN